MSRDVKVKMRFVVEVERTTCSNDPQSAVDAIREELRIESAGFIGHQHPQVAEVRDAFSDDLLLLMSGGHVIARSATQKVEVDPTIVIRFS